MPRNVLIVKSNLEPFRVPFYAGLHQRLALDGISLRVAVPSHRCQNYAHEWIVPVPCRELRISSKSATWQDVRDLARGADLVIAQQCARELTNYWLLMRRRLYGYKFALWGHGKEFQRTWTTPLTEYMKRKLFRNVDFWFAYTPAVASLLAKEGFPADRICAVYNSIDTRNEAAMHASVSDADKQAIRDELHMPKPARLVSYCGSIYKAKRIDVLLKACEQVRRAGIDLHLAIIGDGKEREKMNARSSRERWIHVVGPARGLQKARCLAASDCMAIPGVVGLAVVDAFAHECPLVTTKTRGHGPEIEYLADGVNGLITDETAAAFSDGIKRLLIDASLRQRLQLGCRDSASLITLENMVGRFAQGISLALENAS